MEPHNLRDGGLVGKAQFDVSVQPSCTCQSRVQHIGVIAGTNHHDPITSNRTIERRQQSIDHLKVIPTVLGITRTGTVTKAVDLVEEQDAGGAIPCLDESLFHLGQQVAKMAFRLPIRVRR